MKWIKASERLPDKKGCYFIRDHRYDGCSTTLNGKNSTSYFDPTFRGQSLLMRYPNQVEWLDETETDSDQVGSWAKKRVNK